MQTDFTTEESASAVSPRLLRSWKEVADRLNVSVRTAQAWEKKLGLPIQRLGSGKKSRILADPEQLEKWLRQNPGSPSPEPADSGTAVEAEANPKTDLNPARPIVPPRINQRTYTVLKAAAALLLLLLLPFQLRPGVVVSPNRIRLENRFLLAFDGHNRFLWQMHLEDVDSQSVLSLSSSLVRDIDGDGGREVLVSYMLGSEKSGKHKLICLSSQGKKRWEYLSDLTPDPKRATNSSSRSSADKLLLVLGQDKNFILFAPQGELSLGPVALLEAETGRLAEKYQHWEPTIPQTFAKVNWIP